MIPALTVLIVAIVLGVVIHQQRGINSVCQDDPKYHFTRGKVWRQ